MLPAKLGGELTHRTVRTLARGHRLIDASAAPATPSRWSAPTCSRSATTCRRPTSTSSTRCSPRRRSRWSPSSSRASRASTSSTRSGRWRAIPTTIICGTADRLTSIGHSRKLHEMIAGSVLLECEKAGHMVTPRAARAGQRGAGPAALGGRRAGRHAVSSGDAHVEVKPVGADEALVVHAVVHAAFEARPPLDPPAAALAETLEQLEARLAVHGGLLARVHGEPGRRPGPRPGRQHHVPAPVRRGAGDAGPRRGGGAHRRRGRGSRRVRRPHRGRPRGAARDDPVLGAPGLQGDPPRRPERRAAPPAAHRRLQGARRRARCAGSAGRSPGSSRRAT